MPTSMVTHALQQATAVGDLATVRQCMAAYVYDHTLRWSAVHRAAAVDALVSVLTTFPRDARVVGGALCALVHVSACLQRAAVPIVTVVGVAERHAATDVVVVLQIHR